MKDLQNAYHDSCNGDIRKITLWRLQILILMFLAPIMQNRCSLLMRKVNGEASLARWCSRCLNLHFAIDDLALDSPVSWRFWRGFSKTVHQQALWSMDPSRTKQIDEDLDENCWKKVGWSLKSFVVISNLYSLLNPLC